MNAYNPVDWNLSIKVTAPNLIVSFQNFFVSWVKVSCSILVSARSDIFLGSALIRIDLISQIYREVKA
jgi:hypothetical protein